MALHRIVLPFPCLVEEPKMISELGVDEAVCKW